MSKKVLIIVENMPVPYDTRVWKEATSLQRNGYEVSVICPRGKGCEKGYEVLDGVHIYRHPRPYEANGTLGYLFEYGGALAWEFLYAWRVFFSRGFHVLQGCNPPDNIFMVALPFKLFGVKYIFDHHDANPELYAAKFGDQGLLYKIQAWLEKLTYRSSDVVMATNESYRQLAIQRGKRAPKDVFVVRNGPDLSWFKPMTPKSELKYGKPHLVGYVGNMGDQDGLDLLLKSAEYIRKKGRRDIHFTCVGGGPGLPGLRQMVKDMDLQEMVNFTGRVSDEDLLQILSTADVCVNPDKPCEMNSMSTMIKIMEYMALGKPIVQFDLKEGRFSAQQASLYAATGDGITDFAEKIVWLMDHPEERKRMGEFGRGRVENELAWEFSEKHLLSAYERAFQKRSA